MRNKHGWIEIVEAFVSILLIVGVLLIVINRYSPSSQPDISKKVYNAEISIIREVQTNTSLRNEIITVFDNANATIIWTNASFPANVKSLIISRTPNYLDCQAYICNTNSTCFLESYSNKDTYAQAGIISSTKQDYNPAQLKLFCWAK